MSRSSRAVTGVSPTGKSPRACRLPRARGGDNGGREQISPGTANDRFLLRRAAASPRGGVLFQTAPAIFSMIANAIDAANTRNIQIRITFGMPRLFSITNLASSHSSKGRSPISRERHVPLSFFSVTYRRSTPSAKSLLGCFAQNARMNSAWATRGKV